jgi:hypothetical protein
VSSLCCPDALILADLSCCPVRVALSQMSFVSCPATIVLSPSNVLAVLSLLSYSGSLVFCFLSWQPCPLLPILDVLSWLCSLSVQSLLFRPSCLSWLSYPGCSFPAVLRQLPAVLCQLSCASCPAPANLSSALLTLLFCHCCYILSCALCSAQAYLSRLNCQVSGSPF